MAETEAQKAQRLADLIINRVKKNVSCTDDDLFRNGFTTDDLHQLAPRVRPMLSAIRLPVSPQAASVHR